VVLLCYIAQTLMIGLVIMVLAATVHWIFSKALEEADEDIFGAPTN